jgi:16S rRNA (guanine527-N7)-methyltransferase
VDATRIAELLEPFLAGLDSLASTIRPPAAREPAFLTTTQLKQISTYVDILLHWNTRINLTAVRSPEEIVTRHFGESLFAARHLFPSADASAAAKSPGHAGTAASAVPPSFGSAPEHSFDLIDLGSGAGFPGVPIKIWAPGIYLTLIESNYKKATFLREITRALTLTDVNVFAGRAEDLRPRQPHPAPAHIPPAHPPAEALPDRQAGVVTLRAVERFNSILPVAASLVAAEGRLALLIGKAQVPTALSILPAFHWRDPLPVPLSKNRVLLVGSPERQESQQQTGGTKHSRIVGILDRQKLKACQCGR